MREELQERDYLVLSAIADAPDGVLRFENVGDIPSDVLGWLHRLDLVLPTFIGWRTTTQGDAKLATYRQAPAALATAADAGEVTVLCKCGYTAAQHWANGNCPGDGYPYQDAPENHVDVPALMAEVERLQDALAAARDEFERVWSDGNLYIVTMK